MMSEKEIASNLSGLPISALRYYETIPSTNDDALRWAEEGAPSGSLVVANEQTAGRGRLNRRWVTRPGSALAFSLLLRPSEEEAERLMLFSPLAALALRDTLAQRYGLGSQIKWPNDVLLSGRKVAGILVESAWLGSDLQCVVIGVGVNVAPPSVPPANELIFPATSVEDQLGRPVERVELLRGVLEGMFAWRPRLGSAEFYQTWGENLAYQGEWVTVQQPGQPALAGQVIGIATDGNLRLQTEEGRIISVAAGDVRLRPMNKDLS